MKALIQIAAFIFILHRAEPIPFFTPTNRPTGKEMPIDSITGDLVLVTGGSFSMGDSGGNFDQKPVHKVSLKSFYIGKYEVSQQQWQSLMGYNPSQFDTCPACPVENVSWNDANEFIAKLNSLSKKHFRLPTEAEWEFAATGGDKTHGYKYSGGNVISEVAWFDANSLGKTNEHGKKQANELGIYDMSGNVAEWCSDWYDEQYYSKSPSENPRGPAEPGDYRARVVRGGSWGGLERYCAITFRFNMDQIGQLNGIGFRLAMDP